MLLADPLHILRCQVLENKLPVLSHPVGWCMR